MSIVHKSVINKYLTGLDNNKVGLAYEQFKKFYGDKLRLHNIMQLKEENYQEGFLREVFVQTLGYTINPDKNYNLTTEYKNQKDSRKVDGAILKDGKAIGVIELKSTKTKDLENIKEQAFSYKVNQPNCKYVVTSNFQSIRFYIDNATEYEEFNLFELTESEFGVLYLLLSKESIFADIPAKLKQETKFHDQQVTEKLYKDYQAFKNDIFRYIVSENSQYDKLTLFKKSQKLLDRLLFIFFAEDCGLIPPNAISKIIDQWKQYQALDDYKSLYSRFQLFFGHLDGGHTYKDWGEIPAYNGGLFRYDDILDNPDLRLPDELLRNHTTKLSAYDFNSEVDVNILGHIFEHSLNEIEEITADLQGKSIDKTQSKRKKDGVFYTPKYITQYIVENTIGTLCETKRKELQIDGLLIDDTYHTKNNKLNPKGRALFAILHVYKNWLLCLKIIDPACGSGAFLNQTLDFLIAEHKQIDDLISALTGETLRVHDTDKQILENNIFGVDINEESVEIAKLALWLRTAQRGRALSDLSANIKCGNSLIDSPEVAGKKAFDWRVGFKEIIDNGGFDVVLGNPPYVRSRDLDQAQNNFLTSEYKFIQSGYDLATLFIEKGLNLMATNGCLGFITTNKFFTTRYGYKLRNHLIENKCIRTIINLKSGIFADTPVETAILIISKTENEAVNYTQLKPIDASMSIDPAEILHYKSMQKAPNKIIFLPINKIQKTINSKIEQCDFRIKDFFSFNAGLGITGIEKKLSDKQTPEHNIPVYTGSNVWRYFSTAPTYWANRGELKNFEANEYILVRELSTKNRAVILNSESIISGLNSVTFVKPLHNMADKYKFAVLFNSRLFGLLYELFYESTRTHSNLRYKEIYLSEMPIFDLANLDAEACESAYKSMRNATATKDMLLSNFTNLLQSEFKDIKLTNRLKAWHAMNFGEFVDEIKKQKIKLSLAKKNEWIAYFAAQLQSITPVVAQITLIEKSIDEMICQFYKFTPEEIEAHRAFLCC